MDCIQAYVINPQFQTGPSFGLTVYTLLYARGRSRTSRVALSLLRQVPYDRAHKEDDDGLL
jgi:hypothetical protein